jgi:diguanylate cyclase (GGDEF)-like protein/PAS domain S-box-containing protein
MTLRIKTILLVTVALVALLAMLYISSRAVLLHSFAKLEEDATRRDVQRALNALQCRIRELDTITYDWASWDDTYQFMQDRNPAYVESNLPDDTLVALDLNAVLMVAPSDEVVFEKAMDLQDEEQVPVPQSLLGHLTADGLLSPDGEPGSHVRGILELPEGPVIVSSRPILTSEDEGPLRGWLIMARYLDSIEVQRLADVTDSVLTIQPYRKATQPAELETIRPALLETPSSIVVRPVSADVVAGYSVLPDIYGAPGVLIGVELPREVYRQGQATVAYVLTAILLVGLAFGALQCVMLDRQVLARIMELTTDIARIRSHDDLSAGVHVNGQDELSRLGAQINDMLERLQRTQADLKQSEERHRELVESADEIIYTHDLNGNLTSANPAALRTYGYTNDQISHLNVAHLVDPDFLPLAQQKVQDMLSNPPETRPYELLTYAKSGQPIWLEVGTRIVQRDDGEREVQSIARDITQRRQAQQALRREKEKLDIVLEAFPLGVAIIAIDGRYEYVNAKFIEMFGYTLRDIPTGQEWFEKAYPDESCRRQVISTWKADLKDSNPGEARPRTFTVRCKDGSDKVIQFRPVSMREGEQFLVCEDITERQRAEETIRHMAFHDPLTGLPNRLLFSDRLEAALARARRTGEKLAVMVLDLDNFKRVNDALGHTAGDQLLQAVGERLTALLRETDTICRMGGDEFLILLTGIAGPEAVHKTAHKVLEAIRKPFELDGAALQITTSLGMAIYPDDAQDMDTLIRRTDFAMYLAKQMGRDNYQRFSPLEHEGQLGNSKLASVRAPHE